MAGRKKEEAKVRRTLKLSAEPADHYLTFVSREKGITLSAAANLILNSAAAGDFELLASLTSLYLQRRQF